MNWNTLPYLVPYAMSLAITIGVSLYTWRRRTTRGARPFAFMALGQAAWTLGYIFELASPGLASKIFWDNFQLFGGAGWGAFFLEFVLRYTGRRLPRPRLTWGLILSVPIIYVLLAYTDDLHHLIRPDARLIPGEPFSALTYSFTWPTWVGYVYLLGTLLAGIVLLVNWLARSQRVYRAQIITIIVGSLIPLVGVSLTIFGVTLTFQRDTTPITFAISNVIVAWSLFRYQLFDLAPIAREAVFEHLRDAIVVLDAKNRVVDLNPAAQRVVGRTASQVIGQPAMQVFAQWANRVEQLRDLEEGQVEVVTEIAGERLHLELTISPLRNQRGRLSGRVIIAHDITQLKRAGEEIHQRNLQLQAANEALDAFSYSVSHDLRVPLRAIDGFSRVLQEEHSAHLDEPGQHYLRRVREGTQRMGRLIDDLLDFARLSRQPLRKQTVSPATLAQQALDELQPAGDGRPVKVHIGNLPDCQADPALLRQVFTGLLSNALKYSSTREAARIEVGWLERESRPVYFVRDNGVGFDMRYADKLFGVFQRLHRPEEFEGTGVGLATVQRIIHRHGGQVWAEAEVDKGATFYFSLV